MIALESKMFNLTPTTNYLESMKRSTSKNEKSNISKPKLSVEIINILKYFMG